MTHVFILVCAYNCPEFLAECLGSIEEQDYPNMSVVVVDDASTDERQLNMVSVINGDRWLGVLNTARVGATGNIWHAIHDYTPQADPDDVYLIVDGDDYLNGPHAVSTIVEAYDTDPGLLMAYGSYVPVPFDEHCAPAATYPNDIMRDRSFRTAPVTHLNHPISFRKRLADAVEETDLRLGNGSWVPYVYDEAWGYPLLELAAPHVRCLSEVTYCYRSDSPLSCNVDPGRAVVMRAVSAELRARPKKPRLYR